MLLFVCRPVAGACPGRADREVPRVPLALAGRVLAVVGWVIASLAFAFYVANFGSYSKTYGALAGPIVFLVAGDGRIRRPRDTTWTDEQGDRAPNRLRLGRPCRRRPALRLEQPRRKRGAESLLACPSFGRGSGAMSSPIDGQGRPVHRQPAGRAVQVPCSPLTEWARSGGPRAGVEAYPFERRQSTNGLDELVQSCGTSWTDQAASSRIRTRRTNRYQTLSRVGRRPTSVYPDSKGTTGGGPGLVAQRTLSLTTEVQTWPYWRYRLAGVQWPGT